MNESTTYRMLIADDHQMFLDGLKLIFSDEESLNIVAEARSGIEVLSAMNDHIIDIAILDINMPKPNGFELCEIISKQYPSCKIIILSMYSEDQFISEFFKLGISAYVLKNAGKAELLNAIDHALRDEPYLSKALRSNQTQEPDDFIKSLSLTRREIEIISLLAKEKNSQEIADLLFISVYTVNTHRKNILHKLGIKNSAGLIKFAIENNIV